MVRFIHSSDWQLGARFQQFGAKADALRTARLITLRKTLELARAEAVDALLIAGDLFEDNQVQDELVSATIDLLGVFSSVPIFILPGNHDPFTGPDSVWQRAAFRSAPSHVQLLTAPGPVALGENAFLLAAPLCQKVSTLDPSQPLIAMAAAIPNRSIKIGMTHGALAIEGKHQPNDFPIALNAASRAGLDYLAIGHWHNWLAETDGGRIVMPGTPEPDRFSTERAGHVALVEIAAPGELPRVRALPVASLTWQETTFDFLAVESSRALLTQSLAALVPDHTVLRVILTGTADPNTKKEIGDWLQTVLGPFLVGQVVDQSRVALRPAELEELRSLHPILAQVFWEIDRLESSRLSPGLNVEFESLPPDFFDHVRQLTIQTLREVSP